MTKKVVNIGSAPNDGTGDDLRTAFDKLNQNFNDTYDKAVGSLQASTSSYNAGLPSFGGTVLVSSSGGTVQAVKIQDLVEYMRREVVGGKVAHVFIEMGQSNESGRAPIASAPTQNPITGVNIYKRPAIDSGTGQWETLTTNNNQYDALGDFGPTLQFGLRAQTEYFEVGRSEVYIIKVSKGGTSLAVDWLANNSTLWTAGFAGHVKPALQNLVDDPTIGLICIHGFFWDQGEADSNNQTYANAYQTNLTDFVNAVRNEIGLASLPFILRQEIAAIGYPYVNTVIAAQQAVAANMSNVYLMDPSAYTLKSDNLHLDAPSQIAYGNDRFDLIESLNKGMVYVGTPTTAGVQPAPVTSLSPVLEYTMRDDGNGKIMDETGNGNMGTMGNAVAIANQIASLPASAGSYIDTGVLMGQANTFAIVLEPQAVPSALAFIMGCFSKDPNNTALRKGMVIDVTDAGVYAATLADGSETNLNTDWVSTDAPATGSYVMIVFRADGTAGSGKLDFPATSTTISATFTGITEDTYTIGIGDVLSSDYFGSNPMPMNGAYAAVWDRMLTDTEVGNLYSEVQTSLANRATPITI